MSLICYFSVPALRLNCLRYSLISTPPLRQYRATYSLRILRYTLVLYLNMLKSCLCESRNSWICHPVMCVFTRCSCVCVCRTCLSLKLKWKLFNNGFSLYLPSKEWCRVSEHGRSGLCILIHFSSNSRTFSWDLSVSIQKRRQKCPRWGFNAMAVFHFCSLCAVVYFPSLWTPLKCDLKLLNVLAN